MRAALARRSAFITRIDALGQIECLERKLFLARGESLLARVELRLERLWQPLLDLSE